MQDGLAHFDNIRPRRFRVECENYGDILGCNQVELVAGNRARFRTTMRTQNRRAGLSNASLAQALDWQVAWSPVPLKVPFQWLRWPIAI